MSYTFKKKPLFINGKVVYEYILSKGGRSLLAKASEVVAVAVPEIPLRRRPNA